MTEPDVTFHFEPVCPWTWMTSRWLCDAAAQRGITIGWRSLSLAVVNEGEIDDEHRPIMDAGFSALRLIEALADEGRHEVAGRFYSELGERTHRAGERLSPTIVWAAAEAAGAADAAAAIDDPTWDEAVITTTKLAVELAGGEVGSPVISWREPEVAVFGPIVSPAPTGPAAATLYDAVFAAVTTPGFFELKRGGKGSPQIA